MKRDITFIILGLLGVLLCCLNACSLDTSGLDTPTGAAILSPNPHPERSQVGYGSATDGGQGQPEQVDASGDVLPSSLPMLDSGTNDSLNDVVRTGTDSSLMPVDISPHQETPPWVPPGCFPGALYSSDAGLVPCPVE